MYWQISVVKARYFRYMDLKQWDDFRGLFTDDATFEHPVMGRFDSIDDAVTTLAARINSALTIHHGHMPEITILGPDVARGVWAMSAHRQAADGRLMRSMGHYYDEFALVGDEWKISSMKLVSLYRES